MKKNLLLIILSVLITNCKSENKKQISTDAIEAITKLSNEETLAWVSNNIDSVLVKHTFEASNGMEMPYRLFSPENLSEEKIPLVIFLHGRGDRGTDNGTQIYDGAGLFMNELSLVAPNMQTDYPCYVLVPQCSDKTINEEWAKWVGNTPETPFEGLGEDGSYVMNETPSESGVAALELIDKTIADLNINVDRVYLVGLSMGGFGTWEYTSRRPELFAAAVPMAGFSDPDQLEKIKHIPYWVFHGNIDKYNPVEGSRTMYKLLTEVGADVTYTEYDNTNHGDTFKKGFSNPDLIPWLFSKTRKN